MLDVKPADQQLFMIIVLSVVLFITLVSLSPEKISTFDWWLHSILQYKRNVKLWQEAFRSIFNEKYSILNNQMIHSWIGKIDSKVLNDVENNYLLILECVLCLRTVFFCVLPFGIEKEVFGFFHGCSRSLVSLIFPCVFVAVFFVCLFVSWWTLFFNVNKVRLIGFNLRD